MAGLPNLAPLLALSKASASAAESLSATCGWPLTALTEQAVTAGAIADFSRRVLLAESSLHVQLVEVLLLALAWRAVFSKIRSSVFRLEDRPWFEKAVLRTQEALKKSLGVHVDLTEAAHSYANTPALASQHIVGGLLCLPALFCVLPLDMRSALTRHGALSEVAWEIMDVCEKVHQRWIRPGGARGREEVPNSLLVISFSHHIMATTMVMPVNLFYSDARGYVALVFGLQIAAGLSMAISAYVFSLDLKVPSQLFQMQAMAVAQVVFCLLLRGVIFVVATFNLVCLFHRDQATVFLALSVPAVLGMSLLNYIFIYDSWCRMRKFLRWAPEKQQAQEAAAPAAAAAAARGRRLSAASMAAVELSGAPAVGLGCAPRAGWIRRRMSCAAADAAAAAAAAAAHVTAEGRRRLSGVDANEAAAAAAAAAQAAAEAAKAAGAGEASPRTPDTDTGTSTDSFGDETDGEDSSDFGTSSGEE